MLSRKKQAALRVISDDKTINSVGNAMRVSNNKPDIGGGGANKMVMGGCGGEHI